MPGESILPSPVTLMSCADVILVMDKRDAQRGEGGAPNKGELLLRVAHIELWPWVGWCW